MEVARYRVRDIAHHVEVQPSMAGTLEHEEGLALQGGGGQGRGFWEEDRPIPPRFPAKWAFLSWSSGIQAGGEPGCGGLRLELQACYGTVGQGRR